MDKVQIEVLADRFPTAADRTLHNRAGNSHGPRPSTFSPKVVFVAGVPDSVAAWVLTTQPTMTVNRKTLGELAIKSTDIKSKTSPVTAGSNRDFTFTYKASATEALAGSIDDDGEPQAPDVIEIRLPANWPSPTPYNFNLDNKLVYTDD